MSDLKLVIGNKNFSSWSLRGWLLAKQSGLEFREEPLWLDEDEDRAQRRRHSPVGKVPILHDGDFAVWDSLAIAEYLNELAPDAGLWPAERRARARARSLCAEMHSGFTGLRTQMPMNCSARKPFRDRGPEAAADVERIAAMWAETRAEFGGDEPYLFGSWCAADAFYAPVASRLVTYGVPLDGPAATYRDALLAHPWVRAWLDAAAAEDRVVEPYASAP